MKARVATGLALAPAVVALTLWSPPWLFAALALGLMLAALLEWSRLVLKPADAVVPVALPAGVAVALAAVAAVLFRAPQTLPMVCLAGLLFWAWQGVDLLVKGMNQPKTRSQTRSKTTGSLIQGGLICLFAWAALLLMRLEHGAALTVAMLLILWSADTFAYLAGKRFGRRKLAPSISPGKTVEGLIGGLAGAGLVALAAALVLDLNAEQTLIWLPASLGAALFSVVGDLYESRLKRHAGVKDSGGLLPGHGGVLDRIDGLLAAAPLFAGVWWLAA